MSTVQILSDVLDSRKGGKTAKFNGYLEDYLNSDGPIKEEVKEALTKVFEAYPDFRILTDFRFNVNKDAISNQIIRYKDVAKLPINYYDLAFILYGAISGRELAILVADGTRNVDYYLAKGMYYTLTEQHGLLEDSRQEVIVLTMAHLDKLREVINEFNNDQRLRVAPFQRRIDKEYFSNFNDLQTQVFEFSNHLKDNVRDDMAMVKDRSVVIFRNIATWFLFKKILYVSYMSNKDFLNTKAEGNMRTHRNNAKQIVDQVPFVAFSEMWRMKFKPENKEKTIENTLPMVDNETPVVTPETPVVEPETPIVEPETPVVEPQMPVTEEPVEATEALEDVSEHNDPYLSTPDNDRDYETEPEASVEDTVLTTPEVDEVPEDLPSENPEVDQVEREFPTDDEVEKPEIKL